ncbi:RNA 3'-terminal phosphate cyclase [Planctomycetes bacterium TBK1r]|uniref:RNA 3'-terminal phosphate cyclase n=2 Tax=Stieleria TaxID=2795973 RepID=A0ABX5Y5R9_9BACT|nr:RNA 3'-terminal phosphate cyclase [Planctomycetes bacterium TBK1r]
MTPSPTQSRITIDGAQGEGGGQIIRSSLALSAVTGTPIRLENIRAGRKQPGLLRQHLTAVRAAAEVSGAAVSGDQLRSSVLEFTPGTLRGGDFRFAVGTAGSTSLVAQTLLPALASAGEPSTVTLTGGTHNPWAPPTDFLQRCFLPQLAKAGPRVDVSLTRHGFYPAGGGEIRLQVQPQASWSGFELLDCEPTFTSKVTAIVSKLPRGIAERQCDTIRRKSNWENARYEVMEVDEPIGPGNVVMIEIERASVTELFIAHGKVGVKAERVARSLLKQVRAHLGRRVPVGEYLADQLMMPMGLAAAQGHTSAFRSGPLSMHSQTHLAVLKVFLPIEIDVQEDNDVIVRFRPQVA